MARMRRRNTLIGLGTLVFGASGFIASGAFEFGSQGAAGDNWVRVAAVEGGPVDGDHVAVDDIRDADDDEQTRDDPNYYILRTATAGRGDITIVPAADGSTGSGTYSYIPDREVRLRADPGQNFDFVEWSGDIDDGDAQAREITLVMDTDRHVTAVFERADPSRMIQVIADPDTTGNFVGDETITWSGRMTDSEMIAGDDDGKFIAFSADGTNRNAISRIGVVENERPVDRFAFLVVNAGDPDDPDRDGPDIEIAARLLDGDGGDVGSSEQIRIPYRVVSPGDSTVGGGRDLLVDRVIVPVGHVIETAIVIDARRGTDRIEAAKRLEFGYTAVEH